MNTSWELIAECLRDELQEYGGLLGLFEEQQANLLRRDADGVLALAGLIEAQVATTALRRERREDMVRTFARARGRGDSSSLRQLLPLFSAEVQPLLSALVDEINRLIHRVRRGARQNATLLQRTITLQQEALRTLQPEKFPTMYSQRGHMNAAAAGAALQAAG